MNSIEIKTHHQNIDINIQQLVNQLARIEDKLALFLAKSCLSEPNLQRLLALKQPDLLSAINHRLSEGINKPQYPGEPISPGQLILNALQYIQLNHTQEIPKLDAKVLSHITTELDNGTINAASIIALFRQIITHNIPLNSWLKKILANYYCYKNLVKNIYQLKNINIYLSILFQIIRIKIHSVKN
ncbi:hypothetical protein [Photorhabdus temperata]|uniref:hypothetical protein n=1 Tax=Photorhabdus temperata TaxID=574560 RepID=UPI000422CD66|nr:hypothetical protein [Photorhabdus temperata]